MTLIETRSTHFALSFDSTSAGDTDALSSARMAPPVRRERLVSRLARLTVAHAHWLSWALFLSANALFLALPLLSKPVFFDEKALLAGSAATQIQ